MRTGGKALLELVGLLRVLQDQSVEVSLAADLELDLLSALVLLDPGGCAKKRENVRFRSCNCISRVVAVGGGCWGWIVRVRGFVVVGSV